MTLFFYASSHTRANWFQTNQPENESNVLEYFLCVLPTGKVWHLSGKFDQHLLLHFGVVKPKLQTGPAYWFLWDMIFKIYWQCWISFFKTVLKNSSNFHPIEITCRKMVHPVCLKPVPMATWRLYKQWRITIPAYECYLFCFITLIRNLKFTLYYYKEHPCENATTITLNTISVLWDCQLRYKENTCRPEVGWTTLNI